MKLLRLFLVGLFLLVLPRNAEADPIRILIAIGNKNGLPNEKPLKHSQNDAARVKDVMTRLGGVKPEHAILVQEATPEALSVAVDRAAQIGRTQPPDQVTLFFYFSGHGDHDAIHLGPRIVTLKELDVALSRVPARFRLFISDACRNEASLRAKGFSSEDPFPIRLDSAGTASGAVWLHASADGEVAQESDELGGAVFTYYWVSGLSGAADTNGDGRITLSESYSYAYSQTLLRTARAAGVVQRPSAEFNVHESAPVVLTLLSQTSLLKFPKAADAHYIVYATGSRSVVGDLYGLADRPAALALPKGRYIVQRRAQGASGAAEISLGDHEERALEASDFRSVKEELLARKGGEIDLAPNELAISWNASHSTFADFGQSIRVQYTHNFEDLSLGLGAEGGLGNASSSGGDQSSKLRWLGLRALVELRAKLSEAVLFRVGLGPLGRFYSQTLVRADADRVTLAKYKGEHSFTAWALGGQLAVGLRFPMGPRAFMGLELSGELLGTKREETLSPLWMIGAGVEGGLRF